MSKLRNFNCLAWTREIITCSQSVSHDQTLIFKVIFFHFLCSHSHDRRSSSISHLIISNKTKLSFHMIFSVRLIANIIDDVKLITKTPSNRDQHPKHLWHKYEIFNLSKALSYVTSLEKYFIRTWFQALYNSISAHFYSLKKINYSRCQSKLMKQRKGNIFLVVVLYKMISFVFFFWWDQANLGNAADFWSSEMLLFEVYSNQKKKLVFQN